MYISLDNTDFTYLGGYTGGLDSTLETQTFDLSSFNSGAVLTSGDTLYVKFDSFDNASFGQYHYYDSVKLVGVEVSTAVVPEPSSLALIGLSGLAFIARRKR